ncbi:SusC/RagA family TonB-linked outer membrane protein [Chitinophaga ginsengisoli]|uniref:TonB-linked SusC/RagA family outer membrane protein n=1 Tax=Chitinophaga ginsengisoli TaxID=363837 RepID=A0A2P8G2J5_9BACT|nr:SusC/RagA family TonB-linked outer membrane protein [Chitinophaga ginsengisoli]PSL28095.1 TonB-linked SusC/RagA family outer membrane protein [Chitinophaga ginsengisoli]
MRTSLCAMILLCLFMHFSTNSQSKDLPSDKLVTISGTYTFKEVFDFIFSKTGKQILFSDKVLDSGEKIKVSFQNATIEDVLSTLFKNKNLTWSSTDDYITVHKKAYKNSTTPVIDSANVMGFNVSGKVTDEKGGPLYGAFIRIKGTGKGTATNEQGLFTLKGVIPNQTLTVSYTGYTTREVEAKTAEIVDVQLDISDNKLDEAVVIAYGKTTRRFNTGSINSINSQTIDNQPVSDPLMALEGRIPGLFITQTSGNPGSALTVRLRGQNSIANGNSPLFIVDGVPYPSQSLTSKFFSGGAVGTPSNDVLFGTTSGLSPFNNLATSDIESIEVLKDADATAIYGSRGANGVIIITTRRGKSGQKKVIVDFSTGYSKVPHKIKMLNTPEYLSMRHEAFSNDGITPGTRDYDINGSWDTTRYTDWQKVLIGGTAKYTNAHASISGGNTSTQFLIGGAYNKQTTVYSGSYYSQKASVNLNLNHTSPDQRFKTDLSASYSNNNSDLPLTDFTQSITLAPTTPKLYDSFGNLNWQNNTFTNPLGAINRHAGAITDNLIGNLMLSYELLPGLSAKATMGYTHLQMNQSNQTPLSAYFPSYSDFTFLRTNSFGSNDLKTWIVEPQINYIRNISKGKLDFLVGGTLQNNKQSTIGQLASDFSTDALIGNIAAASSIRTYGYTYTQYKYCGAFTRINFTWDDKYLLNLTARRDGSSRFGPGKQFGNFGAIGAGWIFSQESFMKDRMQFISFGKLRASFGTTGNDQIQDYQYLSTYSPVSYPYQGLGGLYPTKIANPYFGWEVVRKIEVGLEMAFLKDRISMNFDYYRNRTSNQLVGYPLPNFAGFNTVQYNLPAVVQNNGFELEVSSVNIKSKEVSWNSTVNISIPKNKLISYPDLGSSTYKNQYIIGQSLYIQKLLHFTGIDTKTGTYTFEDINKDNQLAYPDDYRTIKQVYQKYYGGLQNTISYKGLHIDFYIQFVKQTGLNSLNFFKMAGVYNQNQPVAVLNQWSQMLDHPTASVQKYSTGTDNTYASQSYYGQSDQNMVDASFIRLKNASISYAISNNWVRKLHMKDLRVFVLGQNLLTFTGYKGLDPEVQGLRLPTLRTVSAGVKLEL